MDSVETKPAKRKRRGRKTSGDSKRARHELIQALKPMIKANQRMQRRQDAAADDPPPPTQKQVDRWVYQQIHALIDFYRRERQRKLKPKLR